MAQAEKIHLEVIDLTVSPSPEPGDSETVELAGEDSLQSRERRSSSRKKRKRSPVQVEISEKLVAQSGVELEEGEVEVKIHSRKRAEGSSDRPNNSEREREREERRDRKHGKKRRSNKEPNSSNSRDRSPPEQRRQHRSKSPRRKRSVSPNAHSPKDPEDFFCIDVQPSVLPAASKFIPSTPSEQADGLILPPHVSIFGAAPVEILAPSTSDSDDDDYIEYLDYDERKDWKRYYDDREDESQLNLRIVCKKCGAEGEHKTKDCSVLICLTCGVRDEHPTRSCPISKICFTCGMKGHVNSTCPNRWSNSRAIGDGYNGCDRCGSGVHKGNECPTLWRLYDYFTEDEKDHAVRTRKEIRDLPLGNGGEGYIADDEWCYNCGGSGHWGDDCQEIPHQADLPEEYSAFSMHNVASGPFEHMKASSSRSRRKTRDWEQAIDLIDDVGYRGKKKQREKLEKKARRQEMERDHDPDDWFSNPRNARNRGMKGDTPPGRRDRDGPQIQFSKLSLLQRLGGDPPVLSKSDRYQTSRNKHHDSHYDSSRRGRDEETGRDRDRDKYNRRDHPGPRYKGGYAR